MKRRREDLRNIKRKKKKKNIRKENGKRWDLFERFASRICFTCFTCTYLKQRQRCVWRFENSKVNGTITKFLVYLYFRWFILSILILSECLARDDLISNEIMKRFARWRDNILQYSRKLKRLLICSVFQILSLWNFSIFSNFKRLKNIMFTLWALPLLFYCKKYCDTSTSVTRVTLSLSYLILNNFLKNMNLHESVNCFSKLRERSINGVRVWNEGTKSHLE